MKTILIIGIGTGSPDHVTMGAIKALNRADVLFLPDKGATKADLQTVRTDILDAYLEPSRGRVVTYATPKRDAGNPDYGDGVQDWHHALAALFARLIEAEVPEGGSCGFMVWGDPGLYDSTIRIVERLNRGGEQFAVEIVPGITAIQALTAAHGIALNRIGEPVHITTGRKLAAGDRQGDTVVMLDGQTAFLAVDDPEAEIFWGAYLGTPDEILIRGPLGEVRDEIVATRAAARAEHGWIMDIYLIRQRN